MNGRLEEELKIETRLKQIIKYKPIIVKDYYASFTDETYNTKMNYINHLITFSDYMENQYHISFNNYSDMKEIKVLHINTYIKQFTYKEYKDGTKKKNTNSYIANKLSAIRHFFEFLCNNEIIEYNPCLKINIPKDNRIHTVTYLTKKEIKIVENNIINGVGSERAVNYQKKWTNRDLAIIMLGIATGLRVSAICNINIKDISLETKSIRVIEKGDIEKDVYIPNNVLEIIQDWIKDRNEILESSNINKLNALFISSHKKRITTNSVRNLLNKYTYNIDKKITPHKLRSTTATNLLEETGDIYLVAEVLGHKNIQNTRKYAKISNEKKVKAANIMGSLM